MHRLELAELSVTLSTTRMCLPCMPAAVCVPREVELQRSVLTAQLSAQAASIQQEREALMSQRINTDMLASLSEQVGRLLRGSGALARVYVLFVTTVTGWPVGVLLCPHAGVELGVYAPAHGRRGNAMVQAPRAGGMRGWLCRC